MSILAGALALAEGGAVHLAQGNLDDQQAGADARPRGNLFASCKEEGAGWAGLLQSSISDHSATPLVVTHGAEQAFGDAFKTVIAMPPGGGKVVYHQQRVLGVECQRLDRIRRRSEMTGEMRSVHSHPDVLGLTEMVSGDRRFDCFGSYKSKAVPPFFAPHPGSLEAKSF